MADKKISELNAITGISTADDDLFVIVDTSAGETKKILKSELVSTINAALIDGAPATLDTLNELAAALADDANFATTVTNSLAGKVDTSGDSMTGDLSFGDNDKAIFGAGSDLQIYHDGLNSYIDDTATGFLHLRGDSRVKIGSVVTGETMAEFMANDAVTLYHNNAAKLATTSTGVDVTGTVTADGLTVDGAITADGLTVDGGISQNGSTCAFIMNETDATDLNTYLRSGSNGQFSINTINDAKDSSSTRFAINHSSGDISFYEDTGTTAKFFWDASAERLGIGTTSPTTTLTVYGTGSFLNSSSLRFYNSNNTNWSYIDNPATDGTGPLRFSVGSGEAMRIDNSGNLLVGKTSASTGTTGVQIMPNSYSAFTRDGNTPLYVSRLTSDGNIIELQKNGSTVGSIGTDSGRIVIDSTLDGRLARGGVDCLQWNTTKLFPSTTESLDLGSDSRQFKDLYLSGGVVFGDTGGNVTSKTLDDYEEGTWTPEPYNASTASFLIEASTYTKIGRMVYAALALRVSDNSDTSDFRIKGLPFNIGSTEGHRGGVAHGWQDSGNDYISNGPAGSDRFYIYQNNGNSYQFSSWSGKWLKLIFIYMTD